MVAVTVVTTFTLTRWLGRRLGLGDDLSLLVATGYSICGASAIAAMDDVAHADEEDVAVAIALVTLCGTLAIVVLPMLRGPLRLGRSGDVRLLGRGQRARRRPGRGGGVRRRATLRCTRPCS